MVWILHFKIGCLFSLLLDKQRRQLTDFFLNCVFRLWIMFISATNIYRTVFSVNNSCRILCTHAFKNKFTRKNIPMQIETVNNTYVLSKWLIIIVSNCVDALDTIYILNEITKINVVSYNQTLVFKRFSTWSSPCFRSRSRCTPSSSSDFSAIYNLELIINVYVTNTYYIQYKYYIHIIYNIQIMYT